MVRPPLEADRQASIGNPCRRGRVRSHEADFWHRHSSRKIGGRSEELPPLGPQIVVVILEFLMTVIIAVVVIVIIVILNIIIIVVVIIVL